MAVRNKIILCLVFSSLLETIICKPKRRDGDTKAQPIAEHVKDTDAGNDKDDMNIDKAANKIGNEDDHLKLKQKYTNNNDIGEDKDRDSMESNCWLNVNVEKHFETMEALEAKHHQVRMDFQAAVSARNLNEEMLEMMLQTRAAAERAIYNFAGMPSRVPAGINLGGYGMMRLADAMLFFHRMKLRNDTNFRVNYVHNDVYNMAMTARLSLNDLHLYGQYERAITDKEALFYRPTFGELELLLKSVTYKVEGRLRLVQSRLVVEHVLSELHMKDILLMYYVNGSAVGCQSSEQLAPSAIAEFLERLKADLDSWLKDYFNDYLLFFGLSEVAANKELHCYDKQKQTHLNDFMDHTIRLMHEKLYSMTPRAANIKTPSFSIFSVNGVQIKMHSGVVRGMDSFYRQSVATGRAEDKLRMVDAVIGFSKLKMEYKYLAKISGRTPPLMGIFVLSADDLIAHLGVTMVRDPMAVDVSIGYLRQLRPQTLVIEGAINRMVGNFKHVLENEIITLMTNALLFHIKQLSTLSRCEPSLLGHEDEGEIIHRDQHAFDTNQPGKRPDYGIQRNDSMELEVPGSKNRPPKKLHINYKQDFAVFEQLLPGGPSQGEGKGNIVHADVSEEAAARPRGLSGRPVEDAPTDKDEKEAAAGEEAAPKEPVAGAPTDKDENEAAASDAAAPKEPSEGAPSDKDENKPSAGDAPTEGAAGDPPAPEAAGSEPEEKAEGEPGTENRKRKLRKGRSRSVVGKRGITF